MPGAIIGMLLGGIIPKVGKFTVKQTVLLQVGADKYTCMCNGKISQTNLGLRNVNYSTKETHI